METRTFLWHDIPDDVKKDKEYLFNKASNQKINNRLTENFKYFDQDFMALSISYDSIPIAVSVLQERDIFNGMARILTRFYYFGQRLGIKDFFVSKEGEKTYLMTDFYRRVIISLPEYNWKFDTKNKYKMTEKSFQWITWTGVNTLEVKNV